MRSLKIILSLFFIAITAQIFCQGLSSSNLSKVEVDDLSDQQIQQFVKKAEDSGLTQQQLEVLALQRGMSQIQIEKLRSRINQLQSKLDVPVTDSAMRLRESSQSISDDQNIFGDFITAKTKVKSDVFGMEIFSKTSVGFVPPQNVATPSNYILGPGDEVIIDIYGASEITYQELISPDGKIFISGVGPIGLIGVSIEAAKRRIFNKLSSIYSGLQGQNPNTFIEVSLGAVRTITVSIVGNVSQPGTYTISSFSSAFNALYAAGGPNMLGSMRNIEVLRKGRKIATLDVYEYFWKGDITNNPQLKDEDVLVVKSFQNQITIEGELNNTGIFEFHSGETLSDLIYYAGGFTASAYRNNITIDRISGINRSIVVVDSADFKRTDLNPGDRITITSIIDKYSNRVKIEGAVYKPGSYQLKDRMMLSDLIAKAEGLRPDFYRGRGNIIRQNEDLSLKNMSFDLNELIDGNVKIELQNEDIVTIPSISDIEVDKTVSIKGEVRKPGSYVYTDSLTVEDLIGLSGGFTLSAEKSFVEVARIVKEDSESTSLESLLYQFDINDDLGLSDEASTFVLEPFDLVSVRESPYFKSRKTVIIEGEVKYPGTYVIKEKEERISDIIRRAGGFTPEAYVGGGTLIRQTEYFDDDESAEVKKARLQGLAAFDELGGDFAIQKKESIAIKLEEIIKSPGDRIDLILKDRDVISVPKLLQTVRVRGEVYFSSNIIYEEGMGFKEYISASGGGTANAKESKSYIIYPNGSAKKAKRFLFAKFYPKVLPGSEIVVPSKPERRPLSAQEILGISSSMATLALIVDRLVN